MRTIAWDVDDVLNDLMRVWLETWWRPAHPACLVTYEQLVENPPHRLLGTSLEEYLASLDSFRLGPRFAELMPRAEVLDWFQTHGDRYHHLALTAVPLRCASASAAWVLHSFGRWVRSFHVIPSSRPGEQLPSYDRDKADFLRRVGQVDMLIDDNPEHVRGTIALGVRAVLFPRPWNQAPGETNLALKQLLLA